ncbi:MAG TPA: Uma2 family endonuclease [Planctomycetaceae bacterium]|nr:Uma2 family endonuclease [Planctomycetaceae bacterium]
MSTALTIAEQRVVLREVSWETWIALVDESEHAGGRMTYDQGVLEIMSPLMPHESGKRLIGRLIEMFTLVRGIDIRSSASTTFRRQDLKRGFEADESYYIQHAEQIRGKREVDLSIDPPPDLVIEVEITQSSINKLRLLASMGIPEVWRYDGESLWIGRLSGNSYQEVKESDVLPGFPVALAENLLALRFESSETALIRRFADTVG